MSNYKFPEEYISGVKTTGMSKVRFGTTAALINRVQDAKLRIERDTSRSPSERQALMRKLLDESRVAINAAQDKFRAEVAGNLVGRTLDVRQKAKGHKSLVENLQLFAALKGSMPAGADLKSLIMNSKELSSCAASLPDEVLKANGLSSDFAAAALAKNYPEITEADEDFENNMSELERLDTIVNEVLGDIEARALNKAQAEARVDEDNLLSLGGE